MQDDDNYDILTEEGMKNSVEWLLDVIDKIKDGGTWAVPRSKSMIVIDHKNKIATKVAEATADLSIRQVFENAGWTYVDKTNAQGEADGKEEKERTEN